MITFKGYCMDHWEPSCKSDVASLCGEQTRHTCEIYGRCKYVKGAHGATYLLSEAEKAKAEDQLARCREYHITIDQKGVGELQFVGGTNAERDRDNEPNVC